MSKVTIVGAGNVGATAAYACAQNELANQVVLVDIKEGFAQGKGLDAQQVGPIELFDTRITGTTDDYGPTAGSDVVVITSGIPRKPGMTREELAATNASIVKTVTEKVLAQSPNAILIIVSNPLDTMTYHALKTSGLPKNRVIGMGGQLDSSRYRTFLAMELGMSIKDIQGLVIGGHGDTTMIPLTRFTAVNGIPLSAVLPADRAEAIIQRTMKGGAELTGLIGTSAWMAPGFAAAKMVESIMKDHKRVIPSCVYLEGQYGQKDICLGVPAVIGRNGVEKIIELKLDAAEQAAFDKSAAAVRENNGLL